VEKGRGSRLGKGENSPQTIRRLGDNGMTEDLTEEEKHEIERAIECMEDEFNCYIDSDRAQYIEVRKSLIKKLGLTLNPECLEVTAPWERKA
jgi:hypothetical protein